MNKKGLTFAIQLNEEENGIVMPLSQAKFENIRWRKEAKYRSNVQYVDLGLPSGIRFADRNYGADEVDDLGLLYPHKETENLRFDDGTRMPTKDDFIELRKYCDWKWTERNGIRGYEVKSKVNDNSIFLPAAGNGYGTSLNHLGSSGSYWSSSFLSSAYACSLYFDSGGINPQSNYNRFVGFSVRAVQNAPQNK